MKPRLSFRILVLALSLQKFHVRFDSYFICVKFKTFINIISRFITVFLYLSPAYLYNASQGNTARIINNRHDYDV